MYLVEELMYSNILDKLEEKESNKCVNINSILL